MAIDTVFVKQFSANIMLLSQQKGSKLRDKVLYKGGIVGEDWYIDQLGKRTAKKKTTRNSDVEYTAGDWQRRKLSPVTIYDADLLDKEDKVKMLSDPTNPTAQSIAMAIGRGLDAEIVAAAFGTAYYGKTGSSSESFSSDNQVAVAASGLNLVKILAAKKILDNNDVDEDEPRYMAITGNQVQDLLSIEEFKSADYNTQRTLAMSRNNFTFCGFTFVILSTDILATDTNSYRRVIAWAKNGLGLGVAQEMVNRIDVIPGKHYATQVYASIDCGATRVDMDRVVEIKCQES